MIKINLTPVEELEDPQWWVPDVGFLVLVIAISLAGVNFYNSMNEKEIVAKEAEKARLEAETQALNADVAKYNDLNQKISQLDSKKTSLLRITQSKLARFLPIILLESIQNLKPSGVWLTSLAFVDKKPDPNQSNASMMQASQTPPAPQDPRSAKPGQAVAPPPGMPLVNPGADSPVIIEISGNAVNNMQVAEFMMSLKTTQNQAYEKSDLRTQLFFSDIALNFSQITSQKTTDKTDYVSFKLQLYSQERMGKMPESPGKFSQFINDFQRNGQASMN